MTSFEIFVCAWMVICTGCLLYFYWYLHQMAEVMDLQCKITEEIIVHLTSHSKTETSTQASTETIKP